MNAIVDYALCREQLRSELLNNKDLCSHILDFVKNDALYIPCTGNVGDGLIGLGTLDLFCALGVEPKVYFTEQGDLPDVDFLIVGGSGGWFEGKWGYFAGLLERHLNKGGRVLILPSTINGFHDFFEKYASQIIVFAREEVTFNNLGKIKGLNDRLFIAHDLAFAVDFEKIPVAVTSEKKDTLCLFRQDAESKESLLYSDNFDLPLLWKHEEWGTRDLCLERLLPLVQIINQFQKIRTDRLHMTVLAAMLGCDVEMYPSSYFKNKGVFENSLHKFPNVVFKNINDTVGVSRNEIKTVEELKNRIKDFEIIIAKYKEDSEVLRRSLHDSRVQLLRISKRTDQISHESQLMKYQLDETVLERDRIVGVLVAFQGSRGYWLWQKYNSIYENNMFGKPLRKLRVFAKKIFHLFRK